MKTNLLTILSMVLVVLSLTACKKDDAEGSQLAQGQVIFDMPSARDVIEQSIEIKESSLLSLEIKASLKEGGQRIDII